MRVFGPGTESAPSRHQAKILAKASTGVALTELVTIDGRTNRTKFRDQVIQHLKQDGWLEMTHPQSPRSPQKKYRLTAQGQVLVDEQAKGKKMTRKPIAASLRLDLDDFSYAPFEQEGGLGKVHQPFGAELPQVIETLNRELAA